MTEAIQIPAHLLTPGDHVNGHSLMQMRVELDGDVTFKFVVPRTTHTYTVTVPKKDLDAISFPVTKRGDDYSPNGRNALLGLPAEPEKVYVAPEPIAVYPAGTKMSDVKHFDRGQHVHFSCPLHPESRYSSKDPYVSNWFAGSGRECPPECTPRAADMVVAADYKPTRNG